MPDSIQVKSNHDFYQFEMIRKLILKFLMQQRNSSDQERYFSRLHFADNPRKRSDTVLKTVILGAYGKNEKMFENDINLMSRFKECYQEIRTFVVEDEVVQKLQSGDDLSDSSSQPSELSNDSINTTFGVPDAESTRTVGNVDPPLNQEEINCASFMDAVSKNSPQKKSLKRKRIGDDSEPPAKQSCIEKLPKLNFGASVLTVSLNDTPVDESTIDRTDG